MYETRIITAIVSPRPELPTALKMGASIQSGFGSHITLAAGFARSLASLVADQHNPSKPKDEERIIRALLGVLRRERHASTVRTSAGSIAATPPQKAAQ